MIELTLAFLVIFVVYALLPPYVLTGMGLNSSSTNFKKLYIDRFKQFHSFMFVIYVLVSVFFLFVWAFSVVSRVFA